MLLAAASAAALPADDPAGLLDIHAHVAGIGAGGSGCYLSPALRHSWKFPLYMRGFGVSTEDVTQHGDQLLVGQLSRRIRASATMSRAVILALDGAVDEQGATDFVRTQIIVPNDWLFDMAAQYDNLLVGASINPYRPDAIAQLEEAARRGAVLIKWIPAIMHIDPSDERLIPFYRKMIELELPLLSHAGDEGAFMDADNTLGDPELLKLPLDLGVKVIVAHIATLGSHEGEPDFERAMAMFAQYPNLYADISSLTQINKLGFLRRALRDPLTTSRMVYGTDWPLQFFPVVSPWYHVAVIGIDQAQRIDRMTNDWDRDVALKRALGVPDQVFRRAEEIIAFRRPTTLVQGAASVRRPASS